MGGKGNLSSGYAGSINCISDADEPVVGRHREFACANVVIDDDIASSRTEGTALMESACVEQAVDRYQRTSARGFKIGNIQ